MRRDFGPFPAGDSVGALFKDRNCGCGVIGSRARLRIWCRKAWGFESLHPHNTGTPGTVA